MAKQLQWPNTAFKARGKGKLRVTDTNMAKNSSLRLAAVTNKACANPVCQGPIDELLVIRWQKGLAPDATESCRERCKREGWILAQAAKILFKLEPPEWWEILRAIADHQKAAQESQRGI